MKASELRIGNLVKFKHLDEWSKIGAVDIVHISDDSSIIEPIPLTDAHFIEWGFYKDGEYWSRGIDDYKFCFMYRDWAKNWAFYQEFTDSPWEHDEGVKYPISFDIEFVHQIQNLWFGLLHKEITDKED